MKSSIIKTVVCQSKDIEISLRDVGRYMGMGYAQPDEQLESLMKKAVSDFQKVVQYTACYTEVDLSFTESEIYLGSLSVKSKTLARHLKGCDRAILFAGTIGMETERQRKRASVISPSMGMVLDAVGTAAIESFSDFLCLKWTEQQTDSFFRPRFSPGYGDLPLAAQLPLLNMLESNRNAGISLTDALLMIPQKSVSAIIGIGKAGCTEKKRSCEECSKMDCEFRL